MVVHETIGMTSLTKPVDYPDKGREKDLSIDIGSYYLPPDNLLASDLQDVDAT